MSAPAKKSTGKTDRAAFVFRWLRAIKRDTRLKSADAMTALDAIEWVDDDLEFFRSARELGKAIRVAESTAEASLTRLRGAGFLSRVAGSKAARSKNGGRLANTYRLEIPEIPAEVSTENSGETDKEVSPGKSGKSEGVSPENSGRVSPEKPGTNTMDHPMESRRAPRAPANPRDDVALVDTVVIDDADANVAASAGARERARYDDAGSLAAMALEARNLLPASAPETEPDPASAHFKDGADVTLDEFDRLHAAAREAQARQEAARTLGDALGIDEFGGDCAASDVINGLVGSDPQSRASIASLVLNRVAAKPPASRQTVWDGIRRAVRGVAFAHGYGSGGGDVAEDALVAAINQEAAERQAAQLAAKVEMEEAR